MDTALYYQEKGSGFPFLLLHGNGENGTYFKHQMEYFSKSYRVIAVDTRGHGKSPRGTAPFTIAQFAEDLNEFMAQLEIPQAILLGFSDGANTAMKFALTYPRKIRALILNGGNLNPGGVRRRTQIPIEIGYKITKRFARKSERAKRHMELLRLMVEEPNLEPGALHSIQAPTLVIAGKKDMIAAAHTAEIAAHIPNAKLSVIKGDHFIANRNPAEFNRAVEDFLAAEL